MRSPKITDPPLVSIGMAVFNCERFLPESIESLLAQDYENFELIISDNASEDRTQEICLEYQARDPRIQYSRNATNMGSIFNGTKVRNLARGKYFMWASDHDLRHPTFLSKGVAVLEDDPEVVLCYSRAQRIDVNGNFLALGPDYLDTRGMSPPARFLHLLNNNCGGEIIYGLYRLEKTKHIKCKAVWASDVYFLAALTLEGTIAHLPEVLFSLRVIRDEQMENHKKTQAYNLDPARTKEMLGMDMPALWHELARECLSVVQNSSLADLEKEILVAETKNCFTRRFGLEWPDSPADAEMKGNRGQVDAQAPLTEPAAKKAWRERRTARLTRKAAGKRILEEATSGQKIWGGEWPPVSVIVPTYNRPDMLVTTLQSILNQTYKNYEIIVVNDGGLDVTGIVGWLNQPGNITYVQHDRHRGRAAARNTGLKLARGKYIAHLDDDSIFYPAHLAILVSVLESSDYRVAYTDALRAQQESQCGRYVVTEKDLPYSHDFDQDRLLVSNQFPSLCLMHEKSCLEKTGLFDESLTTHEDWDLWIRLSFQERFFHIKRVTCEFTQRQDDDATASQKQADLIRTLELVHGKYQDHLQDKPHIKEQQRQFLRQQKEALNAIGSEPGAANPTPEKLLQLATEALEREDWGAAETSLRDLIHRYPDLLDAHLSLSDVLTLQGKDQEAGEALRAARQVDPEALPLLKRLGLNCRKRGDLSGALTAFTKAWNQNAKDSEVLCQLGGTYIDLGLFQEAQSYLTEALHINPANTEARLVLARVAQHLENQVASDPDSPQDAAPNAITPTAESNGTSSLSSNSPEFSKSLASIIIPVFNNLPLTRQCLESINTNTGTPHEIIVVDNGSSDGTREYLLQMEASCRVRVITNRLNLGFARASNQGAQAARGDFLVFLNNDTIVQPGWLEELVACARKEEKAGAIGARLLYLDDTIQHAGVVFNEDITQILHIYQHYDKDHPAVMKEREFQAVTGACMLVRQDRFFGVGGFEECYQNGYEDVDLCFKLREQGYKVIYHPQAVAYHLECQTQGRHDRDTENGRTFKSKWSGKILGDAGKYYHEDNIAVEVIAPPDADPYLVAHDGNDNVYWQEAQQYRQQGVLDQAEACYLRALGFNPFDPRKLTIAGELVDLFETQGKLERAQRLRQIMEEQALRFKRREQHHGDNRPAPTQAAQPPQGQEAFDPARCQAGAPAVHQPRPRAQTTGRAPGNGGAATPPPEAIQQDFPISRERALSSIITPVFNNLALTKQCLESIWHNTDAPHEIIIIDNASTDGTRDYLHRLEAAGRVRVITNRRNLGFSRACNQGAQAARGEHLVFLNNDTIVQPGWLEEMVACVRKDEKIGIVGAKLLYPDDTIQHAGVAFTEDKLVHHIYQHYDKDHPAVNKEREFQVVTAACALVKKDVFFGAGCFDENYQNGFEDVDLCFKLRQQGYKVLYTPRAVVYHLESKTMGRHDRDTENSRVFRSKWQDKIIGDNQKYYDEDGITIEVLGKDGGVTIIFAHDSNDNPFWQEAVRYRQQGLFHQAEASYIRALKFNPFDPRKGFIAEEMADLYEDLGKHSEAEELRQQAAPLTNHLGLRKAAGEVQERVGAL